MNNKVYLVSKVIAYSTENMSKEFKVFKDKDIAQLYFDTLVNDYKIDTMDYYECTQEELCEHLDISFDSHSMFCAISDVGDTEIEIILEEMEVF
jgi:hypothetical protein